MHHTQQTRLSKEQLASTPGLPASEPFSHNILSYSQLLNDGVNASHSNLAPLRSSWPPYQPLEQSSVMPGSCRVMSSMPHTVHTLQEDRAEVLQTTISSPLST